MRVILRKLDRHQPLTQAEYLELMTYVHDLQVQMPNSYQVFYDRYAEVLYRDYETFLPGLQPCLDDLINLFIQQPELLAEVSSHSVSWQHFPEPYQSLLRQWTETLEHEAVLQAVISVIQSKPDLARQLPQSRQEPVVVKFEDHNPHKEPGLKQHFDRLARYLFVSRLQTYRYLTRNKAGQDRIEVLAGDRLGGIFTNKEKSIYYYIFLTENHMEKAGEAARLLNLAFYT